MRSKKEHGTAQPTLPRPDKLQRGCNADNYQQCQLLPGLFDNNSLGAITHPYPSLHAGVCTDIHVRMYVYKPTCACARR